MRPHVLGCAAHADAPQPGPDRGREAAYGLVAGLHGDNMDGERSGAQVVPVHRELFFFILVSNFLGYVPLPVNTDPIEELHVFGTHLPTFQLFAATTNISFALVLALLRLHRLQQPRGCARHGPGGYIKSLIPGGRRRRDAADDLPDRDPLEHPPGCSRSAIRLWANLLAGHMLISFMSGGLAVLLGVKYLAWFLLPFGVAIYLFEAVLIAGLQAFIFAILAAIYLGTAVAGKITTLAGIRIVLALLKSSCQYIHPLVAGSASTNEHARRRLTPVRRSRSASERAAERQVPVPVSARLFGRVFTDAVARQPEVQSLDLTGLQWLGFALTEACFFYGLVGGLIGYVLA